jgi:phosphoribosyl 1,2-cyclic phosphodiesterase
MFRATFWGVRGSIPVPGPDTAGIGGNTSCVEVRCGDTRLVFDGGTGLRVLGQRLMKELPVTIHLFFSHVHWDHIQGFPFFGPAFVKGNRIHMYGGKNIVGTVETALAGQMENPNFPVKLADLASTLEFHDLEAGSSIDVGDVRVSTAAGNHPGGVLAYRVDYRGKALVYATDTEHYPDRMDEGLVALARGVDVFIYDSQYTPEEYDGQVGGGSKVGWGHSTFVQGAALARAAGVKQYILYHHDPYQDDAAVLEKERRARELFPASQVAREGLVLDLL